MEIVLTLLAAVFVLVAVAVAVPLLFGYWLLRRMLRGRVATRLLLAIGVRPSRRRHGGIRSVPPLGRRWAALAGDASSARDRFWQAVTSLPDGPLRDRLDAAAAEVHAAVDDAVRIAAHGSRAERAHREVLRALTTQRRRRRRDAGAPAEVQASLAAAIDAQHSSAQRLAATVARDLSQLELIVARLDELTAHALELATSGDVGALPTTVSVADGVAALRLATAELDRSVMV